MGLTWFILICWSLIRLSWFELSRRWWRCNTPRKTSLSRSGGVSMRPPLKSRSNRRIGRMCPHPCCVQLRSCDDWFDSTKSAICHAPITQCMRLCAKRTIVTSKTNHQQERLWTCWTHQKETWREVKTCWPTFIQFIYTYSKFHEGEYATKNNFRTRVDEKKRKERVII